MINILNSFFVCAGSNNTVSREGLYGEDQWRVHAKCTCELLLEKVSYSDPFQFFPHICTCKAVYAAASRSFLVQLHFVKFLRWCDSY